MDWNGFIRAYGFWAYAGVRSGTYFGPLWFFFLSFLSFPSSRLFSLSSSRCSPCCDGGSCLESGKVTVPWIIFVVLAFSSLTAGMHEARSWAVVSLLETVARAHHYVSHSPSRTIRQKLKRHGEDFVGPCA